MENQFKKLSQKLKESEEKFRIVSKQSDLGISIVQDDKIKYINQKLADLLGYTIEEFKSWQPRGYAKVIHPEDKEYVIEQGRRKQVGKDDFDAHYQARLIKRTGEIIWVDNYSSTITYKERTAILSTLIDITERKKAEQKLIESEEQFKALFKGGPVPTYAWQKEANDFKLINYNNAAEKLTQGDVRNYLGLNASEMYVERPEIIKDLHTCYDKKIDITREMKYHIEILNEDKDLLVKYNFIPPNLILVHTEDITEKRKAEERYRFFFQNFQGIAYQGRLDFVPIFFHGAVLKITGYVEEEFISGNPRWDDIIHPDDLSKIMKEDLYTIRNIPNYSKEREYRIIRKDGKIRWVYEFIQNICDKNREPYLVQGEIYDITEQKQVEEKLKESEEKYRYVFENTYFAIILINPDGIIIDCNPSTERITGYKKTELINRNFRELSVIHEKDLNLIEKLFRNLFDGDILRNIDIEFIKKDGTMIWVNIQASIVNIGEERFMITLIHDISKNKRAEFLVKEELKKLTELDQIRKNLILRVSHELKTPLIPICSGTEFILYKYEAQLEKEVSEIIKMIEKGGTRLKMLVNKLLDVSRLEYDMLSLEKLTSDLSEIIKKCSDEMMHLVKTRDLILNIDIPDNFYLDIDANRVEQVIINLLSNAIKNTPPKGKITISLRKEKNLAKISIADTGVGLTEEEMSKIFSRFGKIERPDKGLEFINIQGSGLGLFISKEIIDLHGGKIWASSEGRDKGSTFYFSLPIIEK